MTSARRWPNVAVNPLQIFATEDGWFDFRNGPDLQRRLSMVANAGFSAVHADVPEGMSPDAYREELRRHGLRPAPGYIAVPRLTDPKARQQFADRCAAAARGQHQLGLSVIFVGPDLDPSHPRFRHPAVGHGYDERQLSEVTAALRLTAEVIRREGVQPALHPHVGTWIETEAEIRYVLDNISASELALGPDTGHLAWAGIDPAGFLRRYSERVVAAHIKDMRRDVARASAETGLDYRQTVAAGIWGEPGSGDLDLSAVLEAFPETSMWLVIEVDRASDGDVAGSLAHSARWAEGLQPAG